MAAPLESCWFCGEQAWRARSGWPIGMAMAVRDHEVTWQCTDSKSCLRRTMRRLTAAQAVAPSQVTSDTSAPRSSGTSR